MQTSYLDVKPGFSSMLHNDLSREQSRISKQLTFNGGRHESLTPLSKVARFSIKGQTESKKRIELREKYEEEISNSKGLTPDFELYEYDLDNIHKFVQNLTKTKPNKRQSEPVVVSANLKKL